ncbi:hypothetical protein J3Q00_20435 [Pseudomonas sp. D2-3]
MTLMRSSWKWLAIIAMLSNRDALANDPVIEACWTNTVPQQLIDVNGVGAVQGAWAVTDGLLLERLERATVPQGVLLPGYDMLSAQRMCADIQSVNPSRTKMVFGGRERIMAQQGAPAWDWLLVSADKLAANITAGKLSGIFVGNDKVVIGQGLEKTALTDPGKLAAKLMDNQLRKYQPVILFVFPEYQQVFFEFFSNNPLPGVFLSFDDAESVRDVLNKYTRLSTDDQARQLNYYCD